FAYPWVAELFPTQVEEEGLGALGNLVLDRLTLDAAITHGRKIIGGCPVLGDVIEVHVVAIGLEGLEGNVGIAIEVEDDLVEVVAADMHRQIAPPVVRIALQYDLPTRQHVG